MRPPSVLDHADEVESLFRAAAYARERAREQQEMAARARTRAVAAVECAVVTLALAERLAARGEADPPATLAAAAAGA